MENIFEVWTDGSCKSNGQEGAVGGYAFLIFYNAQEIARGSKKVENTTNNRMEMTAIIEAMDIIEKYAYANLDNMNYKVKVYTDSAYCQNCYSQKWYNNWRVNGWVNAKKEPVKNKDLWEDLVLYFDDTDFELIKVKGHANNENNNIVDKLAQNAANNIL